MTPGNNNMRAKIFNLPRSLFHFIKIPYLMTGESPCLIEVGRNHCG